MTSPLATSFEELASGNTSLSCDALFYKQITDFIPQFFDNDSQSSAASDEQSIISRGNSLCCLLQQNTYSGRNGLIFGFWQALSRFHPALDSATSGDEVGSGGTLGREALTSPQEDQGCEHFVESRSLDDMSQMMHSQANAGKTLCFTSLKGSEVGEQFDFSASPSSLSKIKASNFPTSLLRIGTQKCVSRYEGALGTLDIVLARPPLFFRATDPQPRKHTPTLDFDSQDTPSPCSVEDTSLSCDALFDKEITDFIPQFFHNDSQSSAISDEQSIISRANSLCCLLQQNTVGKMVWSSNSASTELIPPSTRLCLLGGEVGSGGIQEF
ncbi:hypothetical protein ZIOFF_013442 [Zingiber officinale]|uniref:TRF2/HOY1 PH-like domain-containing protein n=1 Tax=Zingiber officinale TaxID=94328 RepID=A0A8J5HA06_ZINOF|nr:hypothetical protein ZIOFF_013442 [Zingiber officinale]